MSSSLKNIVLVLAFVILLPVTAFIALEIGSLNENEEMLEDVYREQLDAIIFSINQYSGDLFNFYLGQLDYQWKQSGNETLVDSTFIQQNLAIAAIGIRTEGEIDCINLKASPNISLALIDSIFLANEAIIERLSRYKETGYIKPELIGQKTINNTLLNITMIIIGDNTPCLIFINPTLFVEDLLAPKIQQIAQQNLDVAVRHVPSNTYVYAEEITSTSIVQRGSLVLLEDFEISVSLQNQSIEGLIQYRTQRNVVILVLLICFVAIGIYLVIRNLKKEMQLSKAKADFVANVSHEIRTPLSLISMFNETLLLGRVKDEEKKKEYYEIISKETSRLNNIVSKILSFSQIDASSKNYNFQPINADEVVREVLDTYSYHLQEKGFTYQVDLKGDAIISADRESLIEIIINLIDNAIKYSKETKELTISSQKTSNAYILSFSDKGMGIAKSDLNRVFEKFFRAEGGDIHNTKGTGLGLSLVSEIMKAHQGTIDLKSKPGDGSTFKLTFQLHE